jgi:acyl dehydratase
MQKISSISEISPGLGIPELSRTISTLDLVEYCAGSDDYSHQHWDHLYMTERGFPGVIVHGWFTFAVMCQAVTNWIPLEIADIAHYAVRYHKSTLPGVVSCGGEVVEVNKQGGRAELKLWARDAAGDVTTTASMTVAFA